MLISQSTIQTVQNTVHIEEVIADFVPLKKKGKNLWACCPFHHEQTASFAVSPTKGFYKCFGCNAAGDAITFVQQIEGISFIEAITYLAQKYGITIETKEVALGHDLKDHQAKESLYILLSMAKAYYTQLLWNHPEAAKIALPYLNERNIPLSIAKKFELGYSLESWDAFYQFALGKGFGVEPLVAAGLIVQNDAKIYDRFRGRLMFPLYNNGGQVVAFAARHMTTASVNSPKYINSPETTVYHKGKLLYGFSIAKQYIKKEHNCYLVEGYTDVLAFHKMEVHHVVAVAGTSLTETQMHYLRRFTTKVTLVFDGDQAGIQAALRGVDSLLGKGFEVKVVVLPSGEDPDSYSRQLGTSAFMDYIQHATQDFITFKADFLLNKTEYPSSVKEAKAIRSIVQSIVAIPDEIERRLWLKKCSNLFAIEEEILLSTYHTLCHKAIPSPFPHRKSLLQAHNAQANSTNPDKQLPFIGKIAASIEAYEREVLRILLNYGAIQLSEQQRLYEYIFLELEEVDFKSAHCSTLFDHCKNVFQQGGIVDLQCCLHSGNQTIQKIAVDITASPHELSEAWVKKYGIDTLNETQQVYQLSLETILRLKIRLLQQLIEQNREEFKKDLSIAEENQLIQVHQQLKDAERSIANRLGTVVVQ